MVPATMFHRPIDDKEADFSSRIRRRLPSRCRCSHFEDRRAQSLLPCSLQHQVLVIVFAFEQQLNLNQVTTLHSSQVLDFDPLKLLDFLICTCPRSPSTGIDLSTGTSL